MLRPYVQHQRGVYDGVWSTRRLLPKIITVIAFMACLTFINVVDEATGSMRGLQESLCISGSLRFALGQRVLCQVESDLADENFETTFGVTDEVPREEDPDTSRPGGANNLAFVVTIPSCPEDTTHPTAEDDPGAAFYDAAAVLRDSICNCTARNPASGSIYDSTMYAVIHPEAIYCNSYAYGGAATQERRSLEDENYTYDRVKVLEELGFWVIIWREPLALSDISDSTVENKGIRDFMRLYAYMLTSHSVAVVTQFNTIFKDPVDDTVHALISNNMKAAYSTTPDGMVDTGSIFIQTSENEFTTIVNTMKNTPNDPTGVNGMKEASTEGFLTYYYNQYSSIHSDVTSTLGNTVITYSSDDGCGKPWLCTYDNNWGVSTRDTCIAKHRAWFEQRANFETVNWSKDDYVNTTTGANFHYDVFYGYCTANGANGYQNGALHTSVEQVYEVEIPALDGLAAELDVEGRDIDGDGRISVSLPVSSSGRLLVMLARYTDTSLSTHLPVGRSYDGHDWESVAGPYESSVSFSCTNDAPKRCIVDFGLVKNQDYYITYYQHEISDKAKVARFLETVTFGATQDLIDNFDYSNLPLSMAQFVESQITKPITSHREYYRARMNPPQLQTTLNAVSGPHACQENSRWRRFAFTIKDMKMSQERFDIFNLTISTEVNGEGTAYVLSMAGKVRTVLEAPLTYYTRFDHNETAALDMNAEYQICYVEEIEGSRRSEVSNISPYTFSLKIGSSCRPIVGGNPSVNLDSNFVDTSSVLQLDLVSAQVVDIGASSASGSLVLLKEPILNNPNCELFPDPLKNIENDGAWYVHPDPPVFATLPDSSYALYDSRLLLDENTIQNPLMDGGGGKVLASLSETSSDPTSYVCANARQTIFNEQYCKLSTEPNVCNAVYNNQFNTLEVTKEKLVTLIEKSQRKVVVVEGLSITDAAFPTSPCQQRSISRWRPVSGTETDCNLNSSIDQNTRTQLSAAIYATRDENQLMSDVFFRGICSQADMEKVGMKVFVNELNQCYENVHPKLMSVFDLTGWEVVPNEASTTGTFTVPSMTVWESRPSSIGSSFSRLGDFIDYNDLPNPVKNDEVSTWMGGADNQVFRPNEGGTLVCGSEGEIASNPNLDDYFEHHNAALGTSTGTRQMQAIWAIAALSAPDQLRQRMAFALSQILVVDPGVTVCGGLCNEMFIYFYDIFVRNGLGNYRDVLREVAYNSRMGEMLTYVRNKSRGHIWHAEKADSHPDENFARELMQLFTVGLVKLNPDGTVIKNEAGIAEKTYDSKDIVSFARAWTGFDITYRRGNYEDLSDPSRWDRMDPLEIQSIGWRDWFPKRGLNGKFIGDRYPLCEDLPSKAFLRIGAKYRLLGGSSKLKWQSNNANWDGIGSKRFVLNPGDSILYQKLCAEENGVCTYPSVVTLDENLACSGTECNVDTIRGLQIAHGINIFYEYLRPPCVHFAFYNDAKKLSAGWNDDLNMCGNPKIPSATEACCGLHNDVHENRFGDDNVADRPCEYLGERITYFSNSARCYELGGFPCDPERFERTWEYGDKDCSDHAKSDNNRHENNIWHWTTASCDIKASVDSSGLVAIIHDPDESDTVAAHVKRDETVSYFSIHWQKDASGNDIYPSLDNACGNGVCTEGNDNTCECSTKVVESEVFDRIPTRKEILSELSIGAFPVEMFDVNEYELIDTSLDGVEAYRKLTPDQTHFPSPAPVSDCELNFLGWNANLEKGDLSGWGCYGCTAYLYAPGYGDTGYAVMLNQTTQAITHNIHNEATNCLSPGMTLFFTHKVKLLNTADPNVLIDCGSNGIKCPGVRLRLRYGPNNVDVWEWYINGIPEGGWVPGEWNTYAAHFTLPDHWEPPYSLWRVDYITGHDHDSDYMMLIDDANIFLSSSAPSSSPSLSSVPTFIAPSISAVPSSSPSTVCEGQFPAGEEKVLLEKNYDSGTSEGSSGFGGTLASYESGVDGTKAISFTYSSTPGHYLPAIRTNVNYKDHCLRPGVTIGISFKAKLLNAIDMSEMSCNPSADANCPEARLRTRRNDGSLNFWIKDLPLGFTEWNPNEWNSYYSTYTIPEGTTGTGWDWFLLDITMGSPYAGGAVILVVDDVKVAVVDADSGSRRRLQENVFDKDTVFKILDENREPAFFKNTQSTVTFGDLYNVRNPPQFIDIAEPALRDAHYETDAVLDHLLLHQNTAQFISKNLIQHFGISNPSPRYVENVAQAFKSGSFEWTDGSNSKTFGGNRWGDLASTAAAIVLDREATSEVLNADPSYGSLKEPLVKVIAFMRNMNFQRSDYSKLREGILAGGLATKIGQGPYEAPSVFSFFSPGFSPPGPLGKSLLLSPESQVLSAVTVVGMTNGLFALISNGLNDCWGGIGHHRSTGCNFASGYVTYTPPGDTSNATVVVNSLADLITSGRLSQANRVKIEETYSYVYHNDGQDAALRVAQQLMVTTPEFQTNNVVESNGIERTPASPSESNNEPYKALVYIYLFGGLDSFYMLAPHSSCGSLYQEYETIRGEAGLRNDQAYVIETSGQPCTKFNLIDSLPRVKELYDQGDALFFANIGHLDKPVTSSSWYADTKAQLFSHFHMQEEQQYVDAFREAVGTGVMGRLLDVLQGRNYTVSPIGINGNSKSLSGNPELARSVDVIPWYGIDEFYPQSASSSLSKQEMENIFLHLNNRTKAESGLFGEHWSQAFVNAIDRNENIRAAVSDVTLSRSYSGSAGNRLSMAAKIIRSREYRQVNRDAIYFTLGGYDSHFEMMEEVPKNLGDINLGLDAFTREMEDIGLSDSVTVLVVSEFGRTLTLNSGGGTDHAWGGNYFMVGGAVNGGKIVGQYPSTFSESDPSSCGRGRLIPTRPWEAMWNGVAQWFGATSDEMDYILPNRDSFPEEILFSKTDLFSSD